MKRRDFLKKAGVGAAAVAATTVSAPFVHAQKKTTIKWRMQTYAGAALSAHVCKPAIDAFNKVADGEMVIELYNADQLVPTGELFRAMQKGTIDAVQSDDDSIAAPVDVSMFGAYFPFASRYSLDVPALFNWYGLNEIWEEAFTEVKGVTWLSCRGLGPVQFRYHQADPTPYRPQGTENVHVSHRGQVHATIRRHPGGPALGGHRDGGSNG